jgi:hypothetical protein
MAEAETSQIGQWDIPVLYSHHPTLTIEELDFYPLIGISKVENAGQWHG